MKQKKFNLVIIIAFIIISAVIISTSIRTNEETFPKGLNDEEKVYCSATLADDFADNLIVIVLKNSESLRIKKYKIRDFSDINCVAIEDLTEYTTEIVKQQLIAEKTGNWSALEDRIEHNMLIDINNFHRILCLTLNTHSKQIVLDKIKILENREEILSAEPDYIIRLDTIKK